jgi:hypothetical protein
MEEISYRALRERQQKDINKFPMFWAFSDEQFVEGMRRLGLEPEQTSEICRMPAGGFSRKSDVSSFIKMMERHDAEMQASVDADVTGEGFIFDMFNYELANHEYVYTRDVSDALRALGLSIEEVRASEKLKYGLKKAIAAQRDEE